jgi:hypothetical protein
MITFDSHNYALGLPVLTVGLAILALWYDTRPYVTFEALALGR